jgi:hypothetical protein
MKKAKVIFILVHLVIVLGFGSFIYFKFFLNQKEPVPAAVSLDKFVVIKEPAVVLGSKKNRTQQMIGGEATQQSTQEKKVSRVTAALPEGGTAMSVTFKYPDELNLDLPFYTQAPFANWDMPWQEACEEASVLLVANGYYKHNWTKEEFNDQILKLVEWEKTRFGDYKHTSAAQTGEILKEYLGLDYVIRENPTFDDVKSAIGQGHLIVMTFDGKVIGNPNYKNGGPVYHAMVIKGYKDIVPGAAGSAQKIITHDVGTRKGEDYVYKWSTLQNALHDWDEPVKNGAKRMIEVLPPAADSSTGTAAARVSAEAAKF